MATPNLRVIVDWNDDAFFEPTIGSDPLNLLPTPLSWADLDRVAVSTATFTHGAEVTDYGIRYQRVITGTGTFGGIRYGYTGSVASSIPVSESTSYRMTVWMRGIAGSYGTTLMRLEIRDQDFNEITASSQPSLTASWSKYTITFTTGVGDTHVILSIIKNNNANNITFDITGLMLTAGTTAVNSFNAGGTYSAYEDISDDVQQATWSQQMDTQRRTPDEGKLTLTLDNSTRKYSPRYASSPLYGAFKHGLRVRVEVQRVSTSVWETLWGGWITGYDVTPGKTIGSKQATITASQGIFNLDAVPLRDSLQEDVTIDAVLPNILMTGWCPPLTPYVFIADVSKADEDAWTPDVGDFITTLDTGITEFPLVGDGWTDADTRPRRVLEQLMEVERGWLYLGRDGRMNFKSRESVQWNTSADHTLDLDTQARPLEYAFGPGEINSVALTYYPPGESENQILWTRRGTKLCRARDSRRVDAKFEYEEGQKKTVKSINDFGDGGNDSTISAVDANGNVYDSKYYDATVDLRNGKGVITIFNRGPVDAYFSLMLKGTIEINADSEQVQVTADNTSFIRYVPIKNRLLKSEDMAVDLGNAIISQHSDDYDEFRSFEVVSRDADWLDRALDIAPGQVVELSEYQTAVEDKKHFVTGNEYQWRPGELRAKFATTRVDETAYWILGTSELSHETVLAY